MKEALYKLPQEFVSKLKRIYPSHYQAILNTFLNKKIPSFRINYLKTDLRDLRKRLIEERVRFKELPFPKGTFLLKSQLRPFQNTRLYQEGVVYVQNVSSMLVPVVLEPCNGERILDLCAAPGAKTTQIVSLASEAEVVAVEKARIRYYKLMANLKIQGVQEKVTLHLYDGIWVRKKYPQYFDRVLVDVPCSVEGRFNVINPRSFKYWKGRKVKEMVHTQKKLLYAAFYALKENGILVYSTCTFSPEENEGMINWFINKFKEKVEILPIKLPLGNIHHGLCRWKDKKFSNELQLTKRILPNEFMEGFFIAKMRKVAE